MANGVLFTAEFLGKLQHWIGTHHTVYPHLPPQSIYFESLVQRAFLHTGWPKDQVVLTHANSPKADITVGGVRLSLKTETGNVTRRKSISITKLCTTETGDWASESLIKHALSHLSRYEGILMLRAIWEQHNVIDYQLVEIPLSLLKKMEGCQALEVGRRQGRKSLGFDVVEEGEVVFHIHFDGADGKCQLRGLLVSRCVMLAEWQQTVPND
jgi:Type II site-specific deoxyribonuclease